MPEIISEKFDKLARDYSWKWSDGVSFNTSQYQGIDFVITKEMKGETRVYHPHSDPAFHLFAVILGYNRDVSNNFPTIKDISNILGSKAGIPYPGGYNPSPRHLFDLGISKLAEYTNGKIIESCFSFENIKNQMSVKEIGSSLNSVSYGAVLNGSNLMIVSYGDGNIPVGIIEGGEFEERYNINSHIELRPEDAIRVLKSIYSFSQNKKYLELLHGSIKTQKIDKRFFDE
jgi:hypothetical protein